MNGNSVCCSIEPGTPPSLVRLRPPSCNVDNLPTEVITAPWGLRGWFSGQFYRAHQYPVQNQVNDWREFYPFALPQDDKDDEPFAVELALGGQNAAVKGKVQNKGIRYFYMNF